MFPTAVVVDNCSRLTDRRTAQLDKEASVVVRKTGGDLCQLESDELRFTPELLLVSGVIRAMGGRRRAIRR